MPDKRMVDGVTSQREHPHLIQRIKNPWSPPPEGSTSVDRNFKLDYMGAAEFEWGALPNALRFMREDVKKWGKKMPVEVRSGEFVAYYVGSPAQLEQATAFFKTYLDPEAYYDRKLPYMKENPYLAESYKPKRETDREIIGWWAVDVAPCPWVLFKEQKDAETWLRCLGKTPEE